MAYSIIEEIEKIFSLVMVQLDTIHADTFSRFNRSGRK